jgi:eukaryotic-like serine/threonine-protein kinase
MQYLLSNVPTVTGNSSGEAYKVGRLLGGGGQGEVYVASTVDTDLALKWYFPESATAAQRSALERLVELPPPPGFLWPLELASAAGVQGFGYLMPLRPARFKSLFDLMKRRIDPSFRSLLTAGLALADSYWKLHSRGLCYCDISFGNVFFDPANGDVLICDNDNVTIDRKSDGRVFGTPRFMAPEVVLGEPPSSDSDRFSLAVLLFYMLHVHHPLEGAREQAIHCMDMPALRKLFGEEPIFIFDPENAANRPVPGTQDNAEIYWKIYPKSLKALFTRVFTRGLRDPRDGRVRETEWRDELARVRDGIFYCPSCASQNFYQPEAIDPSGKLGQPCWSCAQALRLPLRLRYEDNKVSHVVLLNHDTRLYPHHLIGGSQRFDFGMPLAEVTRHSSDASLWGLKNLSTVPWYFTPREGDGTVEVPPGKAASLLDGARIAFGQVVGEIRA